MLYAKNIRNKKKYDFSSGELLKEGLTPQELKAIMIKVSITTIGTRVINKRVRERLSKYRFIRDLVMDLNGIFYRHHWDTRIVQLPKGMLVWGF